MKSFFHYRCEQGHVWLRLKDPPTDSDPDSVGPCGHEAIVIQRGAPEPRTEIVLRPAAQVIDKVKGNATHENHWYIALRDLRSDREWMLPKLFLWEDAVTEVAKVRKLPAELAWKQLVKQYPTD